MRIYCKGCGQPIPAGDVNLDRMAAKCHTCHAVFDISSQVRETREVSTRPQELARPRVPLPRKFTIKRTESSSSGMPMPYRSAGKPDRGQLTITRRWVGLQSVFLLVFAASWDAMLVRTLTQFAVHGPTPILLLPLLHVIAGVVITYIALANLLNSTVITVTAEQLTIRHGPLPWAGNLAVASAELKQLYCSEHLSQRKNDVQRRYGVEAILNDNTRRTLIKGLFDADQALFIEQEIEEHLGIVDVVVPGECKQIA